MVDNILIFSIVAVLLLLPALYSHYSFRYSKLASAINIVMLSLSLPAMALLTEAFISQIFVGVAISVGVVNSFRALVSVNSDEYRHHQMSKTALRALMPLGLAFISETVFLSSYEFDEALLLYAYAGLSLILGVVVLFNTVVALRKKKPNLRADTKDIPSVTVAIPARNEDATLEANLHQLLESTYPKLEILVIDDCSHDQTAQIIKSFAHSGIRFIGGQEPQEDWLGKNYAYQQLLEHASGDYILFLGADVSISKSTVSELVSRAEKNDIRMLSVLPRYESRGLSNKFWDVSQQVARYLWQIAIMRLISPSPPVIGSCMLIERETLEELGGFKALRHMVEPERYFAQKLAQSARYTFITSKDLISDVVSKKTGMAQMMRTTRVSYPILHRDILRTISVTVAIAVFLLSPITTLYLLPFIDISATSLFVASAGLMALVSYILLYIFVAPAYFWLAPLMLLVSSLQYLVLIIWSMLKYEFIGVEWKGRNVCIPVLDLKFLPAPKKHKRGQRRRSKRRRRNRGR